MRTAVKERVESLYARIESLASNPVMLMEVCGTHTMAIHRFGFRARLPRAVGLISGPGCPVCVTPCSRIDQAIAMAREPGVLLATFGDMMRVPGSHSTLERERSRGRRVVMVSSTSEALDLALRNRRELVVFFGIGFETTSPTVAATVVRAFEEQVDNFLVLPAFKLIPPAMEMLAASGESRIDGFICPGHVSAVIGSGPYSTLAQRYRLPCVIAGFEAADILEAVAMLLEQRAAGRAEVEIQYSRAVRPGGNPVARGYLERVFRVADGHWRGIGLIKDSALELHEDYSDFDALGRVPVEVPASTDLPPGCACGEVMRGIISPPDCPLFGKACTPVDPRGPCMVSSEGACAACYRFGRS